MGFGDRALPVTRGQLDIWLAQETGHSGAEWQLGLFVKIEGSVERDALQWVIRRVVQEAEPTRAALFEQDGQIFQRAVDCPDAELALLQWQVAESPARWMGKLDAIALDCLQPDSWAHRWIRMYPRYCGRSAQARRALYCDLELARHIVDIFTAAVRNGAVGTEVMASLTIDDETKMSRLSSSRTA